MHKEHIDFVLIWVDSSDPEWQAEFLKYRGAEGDKRVCRFRDMGTLRYWFRGVEKFTPWVNKVYFVTCGQWPDWLNKEHPKLVCVRHDEFIPAEYLPTFSSHTIELNLHRISNLSERFVYFNDDTFLIGPMQEKDFFLRGLPRDQAILEICVPVFRPLFLTPIANASLLNRHFNKKEIMLRYFGKFFSPIYGAANILRNLKHFTGARIPGFRTDHLPSAFLKSTFQEIWSAEPELLDSVCRHKFRVLTDINQWALRGWQYCTGQFVPVGNRGKYYGIGSAQDAEFAAKVISNSRHRMVCLNDGLDNMTEPDDFKQIQVWLQQGIEKILPEKSSFER